MVSSICGGGARALPPVPDPATPNGSDGTLAGVIAVDAEDAEEVPVVFAAVEVNV